MKIAATPTRILLVEDLKVHRSMITSLLAQHPDMDVVGEATDGIEAMTQAQQLKPEVILMDIGLPKLNGFDAARRIFGILPAAKVIFVTQENDVDVAKEAFRLGAWGYVLKQDPETELTAALQAVLRGRRFLSSGLRNHWSAFLSDTESAN